MIMGFIWLSLETGIISLNSTNKLIFVMVKVKHCSCPCTSVRAK
jgi:hypothetical protein